MANVAPVEGEGACVVDGTAVGGLALRDFHAAADGDRACVVDDAAVGGRAVCEITRASEVEISVRSHVENATVVATVDEVVAEVDGHREVHFKLAIIEGHVISQVERATVVLSTAQVGSQLLFT